MSLTPIDAVSATGANNSSGLNDSPATTSIGDGTEGLDREAFLKLLVAQLKFQDPTNPADTSQMLTQTAQLTMVDRLNELTASFNESAATERLAVAGTIVGKDISFTDADGYPVTERADSVRITEGSLIIQAGDYDVPYEAVTAILAPIDTPSGANPLTPSYSPTTFTPTPTPAPTPVAPTPAPVTTTTDSAPVGSAPSDSVAPITEPDEADAGAASPAEPVGDAQQEAVDPLDVAPEPTIDMSGTGQAGTIPADVDQIGATTEPPLETGAPGVTGDPGAEAAGEPTGVALDDTPLPRLRL